MEAHRIRDNKVNCPLRVILDTNFLMMPGVFRIDIFDELNRLLEGDFETCLPDAVLKELEAISQGRNLKGRKAALVGLSIVKGLESTPTSEKSADESILSLVDKDTVVCTNDRELRRKVKEKGGRVIFLRQKKILELEGG